MDDVRAFGRLASLPAGASGGRSESLVSALAECTVGYNTGGAVRGSVETLAENVRADLVALPAAAGSVRPRDFQFPERASVLRDLSGLLLPEEDVRGPVPLGCYIVEHTEQRTLFSRLLACGAAVLFPARKVPTFRGRPLVGGLFAFPMIKDGRRSQRVIVDRRPHNSVERRLRWLELPSAAQLQRIVLDESEVLLGSGDDLECYYYFLEHEAGGSAERGRSLRPWSGLLSVRREAGAAIPSRSPRLGDGRSQRMRCCAERT